jgi:DUF1680 family protein
VALRRRWKAGDRVTLRLDVAPRLPAANPRVSEDAGKLAVEHGPLVYCLEELDQQGPLPDLAFANSEAAFDVEFGRELLGGVVVLQHAGSVSEKPSADEPLCEPFEVAKQRTNRPVRLKLIPYYSWANREPTPMVVWVPKW